MYVDKKIGELLDLLEEEGWMENSIVVVASDNGGHPDYGGSNYPLRGRKDTYWEGGSKAGSPITCRSAGLVERCPPKRRVVWKS